MNEVLTKNLPHLRGFDRSRCFVTEHARVRRFVHPGVDGDEAVHVGYIRRHVGEGEVGRQGGNGVSRHFRSWVCGDEGEEGVGDQVAAGGRIFSRKASESVTLLCLSFYAFRVAYLIDSFSFCVPADLPSAIGSFGVSSALGFCFLSIFQRSAVTIFQKRK